MAGSRRRGSGAGVEQAATIGPQLSGLVVSHLGKGLAVEADDGAIVLCHTRRRLGEAAVGDRVLWSACGQDQGRVEAILPRRSLLTRPAYGGKIRCVAANLDRVFVVIAPTPEPDWLLVDQYLAVCQNRDIAVEIVYNKLDLAQQGAHDAALEDYARIGYPLHRISAKQNLGMEVLRQGLAGHCSMLAGQSGVGKSSLTNALLPEKSLRIGAISERSGLGRHTTTAATLYHLPGGGDLIDSPGVAVFGLAEMTEQSLAWGYREFQAHIPNCRFNDCRHLKDKGCAVREAVEAGAVSLARYERYRRLLDKLISPDALA
jgi:ribosome biogenesis GTPase